jgi:ABC-type transport system involved in multi-copper enzyme maturation permease subunit
MNWPVIWAVARAEMRLTRRLVRYWVFLVIGYLIGLAGYFYYGALHAFFSSYSATVGAVGPRYLIGAVGLYYLMVFMIGLVFLGFDLRSRDRRERIVEVLDSRPITNFELVFGRFLGVLLPAWVPVVLLALLMEGLGILLPLLGSPVGERIEPVSLVAFIFLMALPAFSFSLAMVFLVTLVVRHRLVAAVLALAVLGGMFFASLRLPLTYGPFFDVTGAYMVNFPSDIVPGIADRVGWLQRIAVMVAAFALLGLASVIHPRLDGGSRPRGAATAGVVLLAAVAMMAIASSWRAGDLAQIETWKDAHAARTGEPVPDILSLSGTVHIDPGRELSYDVEMVFRAPEDAALETALFTLNPGLEVVEAEARGVGAVEVHHENGLLELGLPAPLAAGQEMTVSLRSVGRPNNWFAYLDNVKTPEALTALEGQLFLLGFERGIFDRRYVALMPGIRWLPAAGADVGRGDTRKRARDFFEIDLSVELPAGWLAAGPGRRQESGDGFRFEPGAPMHEVALIASRFESYAVDVEGVHFELLLSPEHSKNVEVLSDAAGEIRTWLEEHLADAAESGLGYPYDGFTLVEVPTVLRGYEGGWRLDTAFAPPSMVLLRESGFPTARFDVPFRNPEDWQDREGGMPRAKRQRLEAFSVNDFSGGAIFSGASRSFFRDQTAAFGADALAVNFVVEELASLVLTDSRSYFSAHLFGPELGQAVQQTVTSYFAAGRRDANFATAMIDAFTSRPEVWSAVLGTSLRDLDPWEDPQRAFDALTLKAGALAQSLYDGLGADATAKLLATLRERYRGETFDLAELIAVGAELDPGLGELFEDWLTTVDLPGFVAEEGSAFRLADGPDGAPRYQVTVEVRNDEPVPGVFRMTTRTGEGGEASREDSDPVRIGGQSAMRWSTVLSQPPTGIWVDSYLSLNREAFRVPLPPIDETEIVSAEPLEGVEEVPWSAGDPETITVDDLDDGFAVVNGSQGSGFRLAGRGVDRETDQGLPLQDFGGLPREWSRAGSSSSWGRYRHTVAYVRPGEGEGSATFASEVPRGGSWELEIHLPHKQRFRSARSWGVWTLTVSDASGDREVTFDAGAAERGWSLVEAFELTGGEVSVSLSDQTDGQVVVADAIRWRPANRTVEREEEG